MPAASRGPASEFDGLAFALQVDPDGTIPVILINPGEGCCHGDRLSDPVIARRHLAGPRATLAHERIAAACRSRLAGPADRDGGGGSAAAPDIAASADMAGAAGRIRPALRVWPGIA